MRPTPPIRDNSRLFDGRKAVTICIAALANNSGDLVIASDSKVAFGEFSADGAIQKDVPFGHQHVVLIAGNDVAHAGMVINRARQHLQGKTVSSDEISECIFRECQDERDRVAEAEILKPHGFDMATFSTEGKDRCTETVFYDLHTELQRKTLSLDFIVAGFDAKGVGHIRFTNCVTPPQNYDSLSFWAIGTGAHAALASLSHAVEHNMLSRYDSPEKTLYNVLAAKFMAEYARDVGK